MTPLLYLMACLMSPAPLIHLAESRVIGISDEPLISSRKLQRDARFHYLCGYQYPLMQTLTQRDA